MEQRVREFLESRQAAHPRSLAYYLELWDGHLSAGLANNHFVLELTSGNDSKFFQRVWEMLLARHLLACGHTVSSRPEGEPDFRFESGGRVVWVEAVSPEPGPDLSRDPPITGSKVPHRETLLRWTTAFAAKSKKGLEYRSKSVVKRDDAYVVAIDGSQLGWFPLTHGASQRMPYVVEATFAVGPLAFRVDEESSRFLGDTTTVSPTVLNRNSASVPTSVFFDPSYSHVSAVIGCVPPMFCPPELPVQIAYNPLAAVPAEPGLFGRLAEEWGAVLVESDADWQEWDLVRWDSRNG
ncbi:hypothetical protein [Rhizobium rhizogenes]|uniref:hypothetical protein n=1 Tax=Rhizobium rhizogenes TaxID=359 RepID=UPI001571DE7F|nr:hypothetical protein [Rhizobium rhizogenes]NTG64712.1 hypothetical protein [Rhizobium rhizogenes]NTH68435.1 hypothetical protein [Rhizobium rhizogenes]NTH99914.1 hypothetical protein [Rhizobium rhizogenes]NTI39064.1 hypothetical protein [Rhizobium rhizogenes]NTJ18206.1 hypothetical protein [Rhizobium rhizogenes]